MNFVHNVEPCRFIFRPVEDNAYFFFSQQWDRGVTWSKQENHDRRENVRVGLHRCKWFHWTKKVFRETRRQFWKAFVFSLKPTNRISIDRTFKYSFKVLKIICLHHRLLRLSLLFGLIILIFGYSYSDLLLTLYGGYGLAGNGGTSLLRAQCLLVACYAVNGITECFARSAMTQHQIDRCISGYFRMGDLLQFTYTKTITWRTSLTSIFLFVACYF